MLKKIVFGGILLLVAMAAVGFLHYATIRRLRRETRYLGHTTLDKLACSAEINSYQAEGYARTLELLNNDNTEERNALWREIERYTQKNDAILQAYAANSTTAASRQRLDEFLADRKKYRDLRDTVVALANQGRKTEAVQLANIKLRLAYSSYTRAGDVLLDNDIGAARTAAGVVDRLCTTTELLAPVIGILGFLAGIAAPFAVLWFFSKTLDEPSP